MKQRGLILLCTLALSGCSSVPTPVRGLNGGQPSTLAFSNPKQDRSDSSPVTVRFRRDGDTLLAQFKVTTHKIAAKPQLAHGEYPYQFDVVEVFVRNAKSASSQYYEFEVSPYNQSLQVNVVAPRQEYYFGVRNGFSHTARIVDGGWEAELRIPLASIGWDGRQPMELVGNAYAALGEGDGRIYWSLFELPPGTPDFHVPGAFRPLFDLR